FASDVASALARSQAARLILLHVIPQGESASASAGGRPSFKSLHTEEDLKAYRDEMAGLLRKVREKLDGADVESLVKEGPVADTITRTAMETACDVIVMGTRGRSRTQE